MKKFTIMILVFKKKFINQIKKLNYYYSKKIRKIEIKKLDQLFINAKKNYLKILSYKKNI